MLNFIISFTVDIIFIHLFALLVIELVDGLETLHGPICELPCLAPPNIHRLGAYYDNHQLDTFVADARAKAWSGRRRNARFDSVNAALTQHQVRVIPLIRLSIPICILLNDV